MLEGGFDDEGDFILFASYSLVAELDTIDPRISEDVPPSVLGFLSIIGMDNEEGYMLFYVLSLILIAVSCILFKLKPYIFIIVSSILTAIFIIFGMLKLYVIIVMVLLFITLFIGKRKLIRGED